MSGAMPLSSDATGLPVVSEVLLGPLQELQAGEKPESQDVDAALPL